MDQSDTQEGAKNVQAIAAAAATKRHIHHGTAEHRQISPMGKVRNGPLPPRALGSRGLQPAHFP